MKRLIILAAAALVLAPALFSQSQAVVKESAGKVEVKAQGGDWRPATVGMKLDMGASISTGFSSTALLDLGTSTVKVAPLTRMQLVDLVARPLHKQHEHDRIRGAHPAGHRDLVGAQEQR